MKRRDGIYSVIPLSRHQQDHEAASHYEAAAQDYSVVGDLLEEHKRDRLRYHEEDRDVDSHQAVEIYAALIDHDSVSEQRERACCQRVAVAVKSYADQRIAAYLEGLRRRQS